MISAESEKEVNITLPVSAGTNLTVSAVNLGGVSGWSQAAVSINNMKLHVWNTGSQLNRINIDSGLKIYCLFISF